jgi:formate dehydrogenase subunit gamma
MPCSAYEFTANRDDLMPDQATAEPPSIAQHRAVLDRVLARVGHLAGALMPVLHGVQDELGFIPRDLVQPIAEAMNLSRAEVHGVITYYHYFRSEKPGRHVVQVCRAEACQSMGAEALLSHVEQRLGCKAHGTSADGEFSLEPVYCLGLCSSSPAIVIGEKVHAHVTPERFDKLIAVVKEAS